MANERPSRNEQLATDKRNRMLAIEAEYIRNKEYERSRQFEIDRLKALEKIHWSILRQGPVTESEALLMVGRLQQLLLDTYQHENIIMEFEGIKKTLGEMFPRS